MMRLGHTGRGYIMGMAAPARKCVIWRTWPWPICPGDSAGAVAERTLGNHSALWDPFQGQN